jgi:hypothetical protein
MESAMRVTALNTSLVLGAALISTTGLMTTAARASQTKVTCLCDCPDDHKVKPARHAELPAPPRRMVRRVVRHYAQAGYYSYRTAAPIIQREWHGQWRVAPNDGTIPGAAPVAYYAPPAYVEPQGLAIDQRGWGGGVGNEEGGGGGGGGGTGQIVLTSSANSQNGPSYNSYGESFQSNPSQAAPFQNRLMGGLAPTSSSSK